MEKLNSLKLLDIAPSFYPAYWFGGPIYSTYGLCNALSGVPGVQLKVVTTDTAGPLDDDRLDVSAYPTISPYGYEIYYCRKNKGAELSLQMLFKMWELIRWSDIVHLTGVYSPPTIPALFFCMMLRKPVIWSPRGSLQRWERTSNRTVKKIWERICNILCYPQRTLLHVTSNEEQDASRLRIPRAGAFILPNGVDLPDKIPDRQWLPEDTLRILFLGRLHPIKGIENLVRAISLCNSKVELNLCGEGDSVYSNSLMSLVKDLGVEKIVTFHGNVSDQMKIDHFMNADVFVLPSFSENFGMVVVEALAYGVPVIAAKGTPWSDLEKYECGLWTDNSPESLADAIEKIRTKNLLEMGAKGRLWMKKDFSWPGISNQMHEIMKSLVYGS